MSENEPKQPGDDGDEEILSGAAADFGAQIDADIEKLHAERETLFNQLARVQADFKNAQKRLEAEKLQAIQFANAKLIQSLIPAFDNFDRALETDAATTDAAGVLKGMQMVHDHILKILSENDVEVIIPQPGTPFDPNLHQALMQQPDDRYEQATVVQVYQRGYSVHGRILRPAQVVVGRKA
ncbi:MAG: nucleotide exchange factor GrpE [Tepidisphaeraceae bacterium]